MSAQTLDLDQIATAAHEAGIGAMRRDMWTLCFCSDDQHDEQHLLTDELWRDGGYVTGPCWFDSEQAARRERRFAGKSAHIVVEERCVVAAPPHRIR